MLKSRVRILWILFGLILICILVGKLANNDIDPLSAKARRIRQQQLQEEYPNYKMKIKTEVLVGDRIISGVVIDDIPCLYYFEASEGFKYTGFFLEVTDYVVKNKLGDEYGVHWRMDPNIVTTEIIYTIDGEKPVTLTFDTKEMFAWKIPYPDCTYSVRDLDANGKEVEGSHYESEHINHRILLGMTMYENTGVKCAPVPDEEISGITVDTSASPSSIPQKEGETNFGVRYPYKMEGEQLKIRVWDQWYIFEKLWEIDVTAEEIREDGMTLVCSHTGSGIATDFHIRDNYSIEKMTDAGWEEVSPIAEIGWKGEKNLIPENGTLETEIGWKDVYEEFAAGNYRVVKEVYWYDRTEDEYVTTICYIDFEIK